jgi:SPP1 family predicted phage head-tail adaptor
MKSGDLRYRITILEAVETADATGAKVPSWQVATVVWAGVIPQNGMEYVSANQVVSQVTHLVKTRYIAGLDSTMRIVYDGDRTLEILDVLDNDERHREMMIPCVEVKNKKPSTKFVMTGGVGVA